jgi:hypothetical protein
MRGFIQFCAGLFIVVGAIVVAVFAVLAAFTLSAGDTAPGMAGVASILVAAGGLVAGASIVLVGGGTYLLASIDRRLELAMRKSGMASSRPTVDELVAAQVG